MFYTKLANKKLYQTRIDEIKFRLQKLYKTNSKAQE